MEIPMPSYALCIETKQTDQTISGACGGDSGGPVVFTTAFPDADTDNATVNYVIGINTWAWTCGFDRPFAAMNVNRFLEFIKEEMTGTQPALCSGDLSAKSCIECSEN